MKRFFLCFAIGIVGHLCSGCGNKFPVDLPKLYPCSITVLSKNGDPVRDANVIATCPESKWASIGLTDEQGKVDMKTNGIYSGVPIGTYKIIITKYNVVGRGEDVEPIETLIFDKSFADEETTPLELVVEAKKQNNAVFEVW